MTWTGKGPPPRGNGGRAGKGKTRNGKDHTGNGTKGQAAAYGARFHPLPGGGDVTEEVRRGVEALGFPLIVLALPEGTAVEDLARGFVYGCFTIDPGCAAQALSSAWIDTHMDTGSALVFAAKRKIDIQKIMSRRGGFLARGYRLQAIGRGD